MLLVEHDDGAVAAADHVVELGPAAGPDGGRVVFEGTPAALWRADTPSGGLWEHPRRPELNRWLTLDLLLSLRRLESGDWAGQGPRMGFRPYGQRRR